MFGEPAIVVQEPEVERELPQTWIFRRSWPVESRSRGVARPFLPSKERDIWSDP